MNTEVTVRYTPKLAVSASRRVFLRSFSNRFWFMFLASWLMCAILLIIVGNRWYILLLTGALFALSFFTIALFVIVQRRAVRMLRRFDPPEETLTIDDNGISVKSSLGESTIHWDAVQEICCHHDFWLLCAGKDVLVTLPVEQIPQDMLEKILSYTSSPNE